MKSHNLKYHLLAIVSILFILTNCEPDYPSLSCSDCYEEKPTIGLMSVNVSISGDNTKVPIRILKGKLDDNDVYLLDTLKTAYVEFWVRVGYFYTVEATYSSGGKTIFAVDGDKVTVYLDDSNCDIACWRANDGQADCTLE
ncbi:MAG: hypothetical protein KAH17_10565 [Bacteroidales bacterium]|nr:hypothetical protein [Bacteroidales bacterium]